MFERAHPTLTAGAPVVPLGRLRRGDHAVVTAFVDGGHGALPPGDLEARFLEMGFVEGAPVELLHEGPIGHDPIAVLVRGCVIALRRRDANAVLVSMGA